MRKHSKKHLQNTQQTTKTLEIQNVLKLVVAPL